MVVKVQAVTTQCPKLIAGFWSDVNDEVVADAEAVFSRRKNLELVTVVSVQSILCGKPQKATAVFVDVVDRVLAQSVLSTQVQKPGWFNGMPCKAHRRNNPKE